MESSSGPKELAATGARATADMASRPPQAKEPRDFGLAKPLSDGGPAIVRSGNKGKWKECWREGGEGNADAQGTPLGKGVSEERPAAPAIIHKYSSETERTIALIPEAVRHRIEAALDGKGAKFDPSQIKPCPFTDREIDALANEHDPLEASKPREMLVFLPKHFGPTELHKMWGLESNMNFDVDPYVKTVMKNADQWFITSTSKVPELLYKEGQWAIEFYHRKRFMSGEQTLHGMDIRRYIAFAGYHLDLFGHLPDNKYWSFLWGAPYDRSGILVSGFDHNGTLNSHGWMKSWKTKFSGSRYVVLAPREEINLETEGLKRVYRYKLGEKPENTGIDENAPESAAAE